MPSEADPNSNLGSHISTYKPLDKCRHEIRFISLEPSLGPNGELQCNLTTAELNGCKPYTALSYCWGDRNVTVPILLNGQTHQITTNLADFLKKIHSNPPNIQVHNLLWIDALCINQMDIEERSHQVSLMREVYQSATGVVAWLGEVEDNSETDRAMRLFMDLKNARMELGDDQSVQDQVQNKRLFSAETLSPVRAIAGNLWWDRRWVVQEAVLARSLFIYCGSHFLTWEEFYIATKLWILICIHTMPENVMTATMKISEFQKLRQAVKEGYQPELLELLENFHHLKQEQSIDSLYALQGLASDGHDYLPDYRKTAAEVFIDFAAKTILSTGNLNILNSCQPGLRVGVHGLPSWVPDWTIVNGIGVYFSEATSFNPASDEQASFSLDSKRGILTVEAIKIGGVMAVSLKLSSFWETGTWQSISSTLGPNHPFIHECSKVEALFRTVHLDRDENWEKFQKDTPLYQSRTQRFRSAAAKLDIPNDPKFFSNSNLLGAPLFSALIAEDELASHELSNPLLRLKFDENCGPANTAFPAAQLFLLESGYLGSTCCAIQRDDLICIILGFSLPVILRRADGGYKFMGTCFVLDLMDGEAIQMVEKGELCIESFDII